MGSVKDLEIIEQPDEKQSGKGRFIFSDRYSVFDWGEMPDHIPHKGASLCLMTAYFFEKLEQEGIKTHYRGLVENDTVKSLDELEQPSGIMEVNLVNVVEPTYENGNYDYSQYHDKLVNCLIPLEIIYRNTLPEHSSFRRRANNGEIDIQDYGLDKLPEPGQPLEKPIFDVSTKLEASDRYISWQEARKIAGLTSKEHQKIQDVLNKVNQIISNEVKKAGLKNLDGKIELAFDSNRNIMVVDAVGTPDECRFSYEGFSISKEAIRKYYRGTDWQKEVARVKKEAGKDWKEKVSLRPQKLPQDILKLVSDLYKECAHKVTGRQWFEETSSFAEIKNKLKEN